MAHFKIDPITFFLEKTGRFPTKTQQNIINTMDSCQFTLIPFKRQFGITTALSHYAEWEFLYSEDPIEITFGVPNKYAVDRMFQDLTRCRKARGVFKEGYKTLEVESIESILRPDYMRGALTSDVYLFDIPDRKTEEHLFELMHVCRARVGQRREYALGKQVYQSLTDDIMPVRYVSKIYNGARFVVVCDDVDDMADRLLHGGVDEDEIGIVDMSAGGFDVETYRRSIPGLIAQDLVGVQPMTANTGQIFQMKFTNPINLTYNP